MRMMVSTCSSTIVKARLLQRAGSVVAFIACRAVARGVPKNADGNWRTLVSSHREGGYNTVHRRGLLDNHHVLRLWGELRHNILRSISQ